MKTWIKKWLGINSNKSEIESLRKHVEHEIAHLNNLYEDLVSIGIDVRFREPHMILIYSRINGGQIREITAHFESLKDLDNFVGELKKRFNTKITTTDLLYGYSREMFRFL